MDMKGVLKGRPAIVIASLFLAFSVSSCGGDKKEAPQPSVPAAPVAPGAPGAPMDATQAMPPGHPPMQTEGAMPAGHPPAGAQGVQPAGPGMPPPQHSMIKGPKKEVSVSKEIKATWNEATLKVTDKTSGKTDTLKVKVGGQAAIPGGAFTLKVVAFVPDYAITDNKITSRSNEAKNPAVLVELVSGGKVVAEGWVFGMLPTFNSYKHERYVVALAPPAK